MLRIAVISLLVANLLLLGFQGSKPAVEPETTAKQAVVEDSNVPTIHLFSEMMENQDLLSGSRRCFSLGPFHSSEDKNEIQTLLEDVSANISERETLALVEKGYWVYMPPYESLLEANQALLSLQALGLKDIGVIYNGDWKNAISLGYFLRQENALRRQKDLEDRNFAPMIRVKRQSETRYWLDYEQSPGSALVAIDMQDRPNDFMRRSLPCPEQNPFEIIAPVSENLAAEVKQPPTQIPEEEPQSPPVESHEPQPTETIEPQPVEEDSLQLKDGGGSKPIEEIDGDPEESTDTTPAENEEVVSEPPVETEPETGPEVEIQKTDDIEIQSGTEAESEASENLADDTLQKQVEIPQEGAGSLPVVDDGIDTELQNSNETEPESLENLVDDTLLQVETPDAGDGSQPVEADSVDPEGNIDSAPVDSEKAEPEPENSVGTGPVIGFGTETEDSGETETEDGDETEPEEG